MNTEEDSIAILRRRWRELVERRLPEAARGKTGAWPVHLDHCFARILIDNAAGRPWREVIPPPAWRNADTVLLATAIALGEGVIRGDISLADLNASSLTMRGKQERPPHPHRP